MGLFVNRCMIKVLYISNIEVPYRVRFFNELAKECDLTVLYEREHSANRDTQWACSQKKFFKTIYLNGYTIGNENSFSLSIFKRLHNSWDIIIIGCYNSIIQILALLYMRIRGIPYILSLDGEPFVGTGLKAKAKKFILCNASSYLNAGVKSCESIRKAVNPDVKINPYYFSSLSIAEIKANGQRICKRESYVLVIGQYFDYKGMDIAYCCANIDKTIKYKFVGMGKRTQQFINKYGPISSNVEIIPFLQKEELCEEYAKCACLLLPTRQECWGLVVNEAASYGTPIVSTWGSGAAVEFLSDIYPQYLAKPGDANSLYSCLKLCLHGDNALYSNYLKAKSEQYCIERIVKSHVELISNFGRRIDNLSQ